MRNKTAFIAVIVALITCLYPGLVTGKVTLALSVGAIVSFLLAYLTYSYQDPLNDSPIDKGSIISGNLGAGFLSSTFVSEGYWQVFWLTGTTVVLALMLGALYVFLIARVITGNSRDAAKLAEDMLDPMRNRKND